MSRTATVAVLALAVSLSSGCAHRQLKRSTVGQAKTLEEIYQRQVLDNLAKFVQNPNALPHFAFPNEGTATVTDAANADPSLGWDDLGFAEAGLGLGGSREIQQAWTMDPIRDPHKLALMRCAYQKAVAGAGIGPVAASCPDCESRFKEFYKGHGHTGDDHTCLDGGGCWFRWGTKKDLPKDCSCTPFGHYCGVYVWVPPEGREYLTRLTLAILDYALYEPAEEAVATKEVTVFLNDKNQPTTQAAASQVITAVVKQDQDLTQAHLTLLSVPGAPRLEAPQVPKVKSFDRTRPSLLQLRNNLRTLPR